MPSGARCCLQSPRASQAFLAPLFLQAAAAGDQPQTLNLGLEVGPSSWKRAFLYVSASQEVMRWALGKRTKTCVSFPKLLQPGHPGRSPHLRAWPFSELLLWSDSERGRPETAPSCVVLVPLFPCQHPTHQAAASLAS